MKKIYLLAATVMIALSFNSCKTNEANYRAAYEIAKEKQLDGGDSTVTAGLKNELLPKDMRINGLTLPVRTEPVMLTSTGEPNTATLNLYNVVVASFRQLFNAKSYRDRMIAEGYDAFLIHNRDKTYFVVVCSTRNATEAYEVLQRLKDVKSVKIQQPFPYVLRAAQLVR